MAAIAQEKTNEKSRENDKKWPTLNITLLVVIAVLLAFHSALLIFVYSKVLVLEQNELSSLRSQSHDLENTIQKATLKLIREELSRWNNTQQEPVYQGHFGNEKKLNESLRANPGFSELKNDSSKQPLPPKPPSEAKQERESLLRLRRDLRLSADGGEDYGVDDMNLQPLSSDIRLTSYAQFPHNAIKKFCEDNPMLCEGPIGPQGPDGRRGLKGVQGAMGDKGNHGHKGHRGNVGPKGQRGLKGDPGIIGEKGRAGIPGLDGRDGLPGEPGLDGIPGRNGLDGIPGAYGVPGSDGTKGSPGFNGTNGLSGKDGTKGDTGPKGPRGIAGPRGSVGKSGKPGTGGKPGISTWKFRPNTNSSEDLLIPPTIAATHPRRQSIVVNERDNLRLRCEANGQPAPHISWSRDDGLSIPTGQWKESSVVGPSFNLTHIRRDHAGRYRCIASNGVARDAHKHYDVDVQFDPSIYVPNWKVGAYPGSNVTVTCNVEAYPAPVTYWQSQNGTLLENSTRYQIRVQQNTRFTYKSTMRLHIPQITNGEFGTYHCVAKNELSMTTGIVQIRRTDPSRYVPSTGPAEGIRFGLEAPNYSDLFNDLCPPVVVPSPEPCPECPKKSSDTFLCLTIEKFEDKDKYKHAGSLKRRKLECELSAVGKPVFHRVSDDVYGSWMRDPEPRDPHADKYWTTTTKRPFELFEYSSKSRYREGKSSKIYKLPRSFGGNSHVVYNDSFFYHAKNSSTLVKYDLSNKSEMTLDIVQMDDGPLYGGGNDVVDVGTDENGIWAIHGLKGSSNNNTIVMLIDPVHFRVDFVWNISLKHQNFGEMFIICGVLYGIKNASVIETKILLAMDLYEKIFFVVDLPFTNPFKNTTMLSYNPRTKEIYSWDKGNQLTYPIKYIDLGYGVAKKANSRDVRAASDARLHSNAEQGRG